jgi:uncharacterized protein (TIGR03435 family)
MSSTDARTRVDRRVPRAKTTAILAALMACIAAHAQSPAFEVASIKPTDPQEHLIAVQTSPGGRIKVTNYTLKMLIHDAYTVQDFQISSGPPWTTQERYTILATPPADSPSTRITAVSKQLLEDQRQMLRTLLETRFHLAVHNETKEGSVLTLSLLRGGAKLQPPKDKDAYSAVGYGTTDIPDRPEFLQGYNASMAIFAARLSGLLKRPVIDETGLTGNFDFKIEFAGDLAEPSGGPSLFTAIQQLGLKLIPAKRPITHLIIDHAEKPSGN